MPTFREPCSSSGRGAALDIELFLRIVPLFVFMLLVGVVEGKKRIVSGGWEEGWGKSVSSH